MKSRKTTKPKGEKSAESKETTVVRFNLYLPQDAYEALERLQQLTGKRSLSETVRAALKLYHVVQEGIDDGKEVVLFDRTNNERERLVPL